MSIMIKDTNNEDLLRILLLFSGHEIVEFPDHDMPTVDAVPVVRCKDCEFWNPYKSHHYKGHFCDVVTLFVQENEYCAWGKRKGGADDAVD